MPDVSDFNVRVDGRRIDEKQEYFMGLLEFEMHFDVSISEEYICRYHWNGQDDTPGVFFTLEHDRSDQYRPILISAEEVGDMSLIENQGTGYVWSHSGDLFLDLESPPAKSRRMA